MEFKEGGEVKVGNLVVFKHFSFTCKYRATMSSILRKTRPTDG